MSERSPAFPASPGRPLFGAGSHTQAMHAEKSWDGCPRSDLDTKPDKWIQVDTSGYKWIQVDTSGYKWIQVDTSGYREEVVDIMP